MRKLICAIAICACGCGTGVAGSSGSSTAGGLAASAGSGSGSSSSSTTATTTSGSSTSSGASSTGTSGAGTTGGSTGASWTPPQQLTWYWQLTGTVDTSHAVAAYDVDGFETDASLVSTLHGQGKKAICYIDVGTSENFRPDASQFPSSVQGNSNGWPGEKWLDIRQLDVLEPIMTARFQMCAQKGFDAVEPDNIDGFENSSGFTLTAQDQLTFDEWVATEVHSLGMAVLQKNDPDQAQQLEPFFDGVLDEQCNEYQECDSFNPYLTAGKPVLDAEYNLTTSQFCSADESAGIMGALYNLALDGTEFEPCW